RRRRRAENAEGIVKTDRRVAGVDEPARDIPQPVGAAPRHLVVDDDSLCLLAGRGDRGRASFEVPDIVERVVAAEDVAPRNCGRLDERVDEVVGYLPVANERL